MTRRSHRAGLLLGVLLVSAAGSTAYVDGADVDAGPYCSWKVESDRTLVLVLSGTMGIEVRHDLDVTVTHDMCSDRPYCAIEEKEGSGFFEVFNAHPNAIWNLSPMHGWYEGLRLHGEGQCFVDDSGVHARMSGGVYDPDLHGGGMFRASTMLNWVEKMIQT